MPSHRSEPLDAERELLFRQATTPGWIRDGRPTSQLFEPRPIDRGCVSVDRESLIKTAQASLNAFLARGLKSASTWGVTVGEVKEQGLEAFGSPSTKNAAHAHIDMGGLQGPEQRVVAAQLAVQATRRGMLCEGAT